MTTLAPLAQRRLPGRLRRAASELVPVLGLAGAVVLLFRDALWSGRVFFESDTELFYYPLLLWFADQLRAGQLPLWIPNIFGGYPILADGEIGPLYPPRLAALLALGADQTFVWLRVFHYSLAAVSMYAFMRVLGARQAGSSIAGLVFAFGGFLVGQMPHGNVIRTGVWLPLVLLLTELALRRDGWSRQRLLVAAGLVLGVALLGLHVQPAAMSIFALTLYVGWRVEWPGRSGIVPALVRQAWALAMVLGVALALAAVQWIPLYELARSSFRAQGVSYEFASAFGVAPPTLVTLAFPYLFRLPEGTWWMLWHPWETLVYAGLIPLALAPLGLLQAPRRLAAYFLVLGTLSLLVAMGHYSPINLHELLWHLPGLSALRAPGRFSYLFVFAVAGLAAYGADWLADPARRRRSLGVVAGALIGLLGFGLGLLHAGRAWLLDDPARARQILESSYLALRRQSEEPTLEQVYRGLLWSLDAANPKTLLPLVLVGALALLVLLRAAGWRTRPRVWALALTCLVAVELLAFAYDYHPQASLETLQRPTPLLQALVEEGGQRLLAGPGIAALEPNRPLLAQLNDLSGYSSLPSLRHFDYWSRARTSPNMLLDLWGADVYVATDDDPQAVQRDGHVFHPSLPLLEGPADNPTGREAFRVPGVLATEVHLVGSLSHALEVPQGTVVGEVLVTDDQGRDAVLPLRAGEHVAERAYDRADVRLAVRHARPQVVYSTEESGVDGHPFPVHAYLARLPLDGSARVTRLTVRALLERGELTVSGLTLVDGGVPVHSVRSTDREKLEPRQRIGSTTVYRNTSAFPRAFVVTRAVAPDPASRESPLDQMLGKAFNPATEVLLERFPDPLPAIGQSALAALGPSQPTPAQVEDLDSQHVRVQVLLPEPGFVVLTDQYQRGWRAEVDGLPARIYMADSLFRAVPVPAGRHSVDFVFDPLSVRLGAFLSLEALLFAVLVAAVLPLTRRLTGTGGVDGPCVSGQMSVH